MKEIKFLIIIFVVYLITYGCNSEINELNDAREYGLNGKVKTMASSTYFARESAGTIIKGIKDTTWSATGDIYLTFNKNGGITEDVRIYKNGEVFKDIYEYNFKNELVAIKEYDSEYNLAKESLFEYDRNGNKIKESLFEDAMLKTILLFEYDDNGNNIKETRIKNGKPVFIKLNNYENSRIIESFFYDLKKWMGFNLEDFLDTRTEFRYNEKGEKIEETKYDRSNRLKSRLTSKFDEKGNLVEIISTHVWGENYIDDRRTYKYDDSGNEIETIMFNSDGSIQRHFVYEYDVNGNKIKEISYMNDQNWIDSTFFSYDYDNEKNWIKTISFDKMKKPKYIEEREIVYW